VSAPTKDRAAQRRRRPARTLLLALALLLTAHLALAADPYYLRQLREGSDDFNRQDYRAPSATSASPASVCSTSRCCSPTVSPVSPSPRVRATTSRACARRSSASSSWRNVSAPTRKRTSPPACARRSRTCSWSPFRGHAADESGVRATRAEPAAAGCCDADKQRRAELDRLIRQEPTEAAWPVMLAELELAEGSTKRAYEAAEQALELAPDNPSALRVHGLAAAGERRWARRRPTSPSSARRRPTRPWPPRCSRRWSSSGARRRRRAVRSVAGVDPAPTRRRRGRREFQAGHGRPVRNSGPGILRGRCGCPGGGSTARRAGTEPRRRAGALARSGSPREGGGGLRGRESRRRRQPGLGRGAVCSRRAGPTGTAAGPRPGPISSGAGSLATTSRCASSTTPSCWLRPATGGRRDGPQALSAAHTPNGLRQKVRSQDTWHPDSR